MAELGLIAAVVQVADVGIRLSVKLYTFGQTVASAEESIIFISKDISHTCSILKTLGHSLEKDQCLEIFQEMDEALLKKITRIGLDGSSSRLAVVALERLKWTFLRPKIMLLWSYLDKLKSSLHLMVNVFIYARQLVERAEDPSVINDQRRMIEQLLRTTAEQSRKYESLKAAMDLKRNPEVARDFTNGSIRATPGLDATMKPTEVSNKSKTRKLLEAPEVDPLRARLENYCILMNHLMTEVEAEEYNIGHDMRCRIRDDVIHTHRRETRLLRTIHGHTELREKMREKSWRLVEMAEEGVQSQMEQRGEDSPGVDSAPCEDPNLIHSSQKVENQEQIRDFEWPPENVHMTIMDQVRDPMINPRIELFLNNREDPWNHFHLVAEAPLIEKPRAAEENGWLPFWRFEASRLAFNKILPLNPLKPQLPFLRSGTSMLVTEKSHVVETIVSSQDLAALTDSIDTETFDSARSEIGEIALDSHPLCLVDGEKDGPLVVLGDQEYEIPAGKDGGRLALANLYPSLDQLLAAWVNVG